MRARDRVPGIERHRLVVDGVDDDDLEAHGPTRRRDAVEGMDQQLPPDATPSPLPVDRQTGEEHSRNRVRLLPRPERSCRVVQVQAVGRRRGVADHASAIGVERYERARVVAPLVLARLCLEPVVKVGLASREVRSVEDRTERDDWHDDDLGAHSTSAPFMTSPPESLMTLATMLGSARKG